MSTCKQIGPPTLAEMFEAWQRQGRRFASPNDLSYLGPAAVLTPDLVHKSLLEPGGYQKIPFPRKRAWHRAPSPELRSESKL
jgi:hypothetical protein